MRSRTLLARPNSTVEPQYNEGPRDFQNRASFSYILLLLGKENRSLHRGLRYIEVRYIEVPLY